MTASPVAAETVEIPPVPAELAPEAGPNDGGTTNAPESTKGGERRRRRKVALLVLLLLAFLILLGTAIWYLLFRQPLSTIPVLPASQLPTYTTSIYNVQGPVGIAVNAEGTRIYVAQSGGDRTVVELDASGNGLASLAPAASASETTGHVPAYVTIDPLTQEVYVSDRLAGAIYIYNASGTYQRQFSPTGGTFTGWQPLGLAFGSDGSLYVTDLSGAAASVEVFDRTGAMVRQLGLDQNMSFPNGVAVDQNGLVYVTDSNNGRLLVFDSAGRVVTRIGRGASTGQLGLPRGLAIDGQGRLFIADTTAHSVQVNRTYQSGSDRLEYLGVFGAQGIGDGQFNFPNGVAVDGHGRIYATDSGNNRVQVWSY